ncbi:TRAP transporter permease [Oceanibacterium hippocampi]|uniref:DctM-like transporters n=1 Tax=Oceanibacterium hippocampi TaxID=745714 RepID=A0A1Y5TZX9_9PROT|nr:TRAP transporter fused permease subunit [Oceanibacterium hippocampi]SLN75624.1 DctM-like transporters [Oceanibacterium hippocampi]
MRSFAARLLSVLALAMTLYQLTATQTPLQPSVLVQNTHLGLAMLLVLLGAAIETPSALRRTWLVLLAALSLFCSLYVQFYYDDLIVSQGFPEQFDVWVGVAMMLLVLEATRQHWGPALPIIALIAVIYNFWGYMLPTEAAASRIPFDTVVSNLSIGLYSGLYGQFMAISANFIFLFMVFGALLQSMDGNRAFIEIGKAISRAFPGGAGLSAVVSSSLMGTVTGAAVANVAITGSYTIPIMKREGYPPAIAGAIEAAASTGGQLVPPIMGSVAFIMAAVLSVGYLEVAAAAVIPAALFYIALLASVYFKSRRLNIQRQEIAPDLRILIRFLPVFVIPTGALVYFLINLYSVSFAGFWAIVTLVATRLAMIPIDLMLARPDRPLATLATELRDFVVKLFQGLVAGAKMGATIAVVIGTIGLLAESVTATGAAVPLGSAIDFLSGGSMVLVLVMTAVMCVILGAGIPTVGAYILVSAIAGPILVESGVDLFAANFFILYFAVMSAVTPPVAAAALAASAIAGCGYFRTAWEATRLSIMLYILPFLFVYQGALLLRGGSASDSAMAAVLSTGAAVLAASATQGFWLVQTRTTERLLLGGAGIALLATVIGFGPIWTAAGVAVTALVTAIQIPRKRREAVLQAQS